MKATRSTSWNSAMTYLMLVGILCFSKSALCEMSEPRPQTSNPQQWIGNLGSPVVNSAGAVFLPHSVYNAMGSNQIPPILQLVLAINMTQSCTKKALDLKPHHRDPFRVATQKFGQGVCIVTKCMNSIMLLSLLPNMSQNSGTSQGGQESMALAMALAGQQGCDGSKGSSVDPALAQQLAGKK